jgi:hypothetical protein
MEAKRIRRPMLLLGFVALFLAGIALLAFAEWQHLRLENEHAAASQAHADTVREQRGPQSQLQKRGAWHILVPLLQHLASALIVAAVMGVTYEYFVHKHVIEDFEYLLSEHEKATEEVLDSLRSTTTRDVFTLLGDIASHTNRFPTIFEPPRDEANEIVFTKDRTFFDRLVSTPRARSEAVEVLRTWLRSSNLNLRFLAGDFIGYLRLKELEPDIREQALEEQKRWKDLSPNARGVVLNYWWSASRCEKNEYDLLRDRLLKWDDPFVQKWILFVPRQMPSPKLAKLVTLFLRMRGEKAERDVLEAAISAIEVLHHTVVDMRNAVERYKSVFERADLWDEACVAVSAVPAQPRPGNRFSRQLRRLLNAVKRWRGA